jgi:hypothetical protein
MAGRQKSRNTTTKIHPTISLQMADYISALIDIGTYGNSDSEVGAYLIQRGIDDLLRAGVLKPSAPPPTR